MDRVVTAASHNISVVSVSDLQRCRELTEVAKKTVIAENAAHNKQRHEASQERASQWPVYSAMKNRDEQAAAAELRRLHMDQEAAAFKDTLKKRILDDANSKAYTRDARVQHALVQLHAKAVLEVVQDQMELQGMRREQQKQRDRDYDVLVAQAVRQEELHEKKMECDVKKRAAMQQQGFLLQIDEKLDQLRAHRRCELDERSQVQQEFDAFTLDSVDKKTRTRVQRQEVDVYNHDHATPRLSPRELNTIKQNEVVVSLKDASYISLKELQKEQQVHLSHERQRKRDSLINCAVEQLASTPRSRVDIAPETCSFLDRMANEDTLRVRRSLKLEEDRKGAIRETLRMSPRRPQEVQLSPSQVRRHRESVARGQHEEDEELAKKKVDATRTQNIQQRQHAEKLVDRQLEREKELAEAKAMRESTQQENEWFQSYLFSMMPANADARFVKRVTQIPAIC